MTAISCPSCSAPVSVEDRFARLVVCGYCGQTCYVTDGRLDPTGKVGKLTEIPSLFRVGAKGSLNGESFTAMGRIRFSYQGGFWDEWLLFFKDGKVVWVEEDEGELIMHAKTRLTSALPEVSSIKVGSIIKVNDSNLFVTEKVTATLAGAEGQLNFTFVPGEPIVCIDGNAGGAIWSIEATDSEILISKGTVLENGAITIAGNE